MARRKRKDEQPLTVEVRIDPDAPPGDLTAGLAALLLGRARVNIQSSEIDWKKVMAIQLTIFDILDKVRNQQPGSNL